MAVVQASYFYQAYSSEPTSWWTKRGSVLDLRRNRFQFFKKRTFPLGSSSFGIECDLSRRIKDKIQFFCSNACKNTDSNDSPVFQNPNLRRNLTLGNELFLSSVRNSKRNISNAVSNLSSPQTDSLSDLSDLPASNNDTKQDAVVLLDVQEMMCGGCASSVKNILLQNPDVVSAAVNLVTETAAVKIAGDKEETMTGEFLAQLLTTRGFPSTVRKTGSADSEAEKRRNLLFEKKEKALQRSQVQVAGALFLTALCCGGHASHILHLLGVHSIAHGPFLSFLNDPFFKCFVSLSVLLGPAQDILVDGVRSIWKRSPNMNSLVGMGAITSFAISLIALSNPQLGWDSSFFEEPVMLLSVVLLGRSLEARARANASSDFQSLFTLLPSSSRLIVDSSKIEELNSSTIASDLSGLSDVANTFDASGFVFSADMSVEVSTKQIRKQDHVLVLPGEIIPIDGIVKAGCSCVDESLLSGESVPIQKSAGDTVTAGTVNWDGPIAVEATATGKDCTINSITKMVEEAQEREAPVQRIADQLASPFVTSIASIAALTFSFWYFFGTQLFPDVLLSDIAGEEGSPLLLSLKLAIDVLVVACPCALGLATPTAILVGTSLGANRGILFRGGDVLESLSKTNVMVFDKTGTLTLGKPSVTAIVSIDSLSSSLSTPTASIDPSKSSSSSSSSPKSRFNPGLSSKDLEILKLAASVEQVAEHPMAHAITEYAKEKGLMPLHPIEGALTVPGCGVVSSVNGRQVFVGSLDWILQSCASDSSGLDRVNVREDARKLWSALSERVASGSERKGEEGVRPSPQSLVFVGEGGKGVIGVIGASDVLREDASYTVQRLMSMGIRMKVMSGDDEKTAIAIAKEVGIEEEDVRGRLLPQQKASLISELQKKDMVVAMVGDGINDAPALLTCDIGIALPRNEFSDVASDSAAVVLLGNKLSQLIDAVELSKATLSTIRLNLFWAVAYNFIAIPLACGMFLPSFDIALSPSVAGGMMALSSIAVVSNSLLLKYRIKSR